MGGGGIVQHNLEDLGAEEVGQDIGSLVRAAILLWGREGGWRCVVVARDFFSVGGRDDALRNLQPLTAGRPRISIRSSVTRTILGGHLPRYQRHSQQ